jgi:hypothetical protein
LRYGFRALREIEGKLGVGISKAFEKLKNDLRMEDLAAIAWAGLVWEDKTLTVDAVIDLIDEYSDFREALDIILSAIDESFGSSGESDGEPEKAGGAKNERAASPSP